MAKVSPVIQYHFDTSPRRLAVIRACATRVLVALLITGPAAAQQKAMVVFAGTVVDSLRQPLGNTDVQLPGMNLGKTTNDKGEFRIADVPAGVHRVVVRHIGYTAVDTVLTFREGQSLEWRITLGRIVTLDSVLVREPMDPLMEEFESNRARGFGRFMARADLARYDGASLPNVVTTLPGAAMTRSRVGMVFITSKRQPVTGCVPPRTTAGGPAGAGAVQQAVDDCLRRERVYYVPDETEARQGVPRACHPQVFVDRTLMNSGVPTFPFDIAAYATEQIEALEWYESPSQTPPKYSVANARCGVLVLHLRKRK